jgi:Flp pilus assembly pilin Flp
MKLLKLFKDRRGAGTIEYALVASLIAIAAITGYANLGGELKSHYNEVDENLSGQM